MTTPQNTIYLDHNATTPVDPAVLEAMLPFFTNSFANAASIQHPAGRAAAQAVENARNQLAQLLNAQPRDLTFTSGATEANNLALKGLHHFYTANPNALASNHPRNHIITSSIEHPSVLEPAHFLAAQHNLKLTLIDPEPDGRINPQHIADAITPNTLFVSIIYAHNETGIINDIPAIAAITRANNTFLHTDATQLVGKLPIDLDATPIDLLSCSAHKFYGPKGVGALYTRRRSPRVRLTPLLHGGGHERGNRSGTLNTPSIVGLGHAAHLAQQQMTEEAQRLAKLRELLQSLLADQIPNLQINGSTQHRLPHTTNISFPDIDAQQLIAALPHIAISHGSACTSASLTTSATLRRMGLTEDRARSSIRISLGRFTTEAEIRQAAQDIANAVLNHNPADADAPSCNTAL